LSDKPVNARLISPITRRILAVNLLALIILVSGMLYMGEYKRTLIETEFARLRSQAELFAAAMGEGAVSADNRLGQRLAADITRKMVRRMVETTGTRARLFANDGTLIADSRYLRGAVGLIEVLELPPLEETSPPMATLVEFYDYLSKLIPHQESYPSYVENAVQHASDYTTVVSALAGDPKSHVLKLHDSLTLIVAVPVQRYKEVLGAIMLSKQDHEISATLFQVRLNILAISAVALVITVLLSLYLAGTISQPLHRLSVAAERVRHGKSRQHKIPRFKDRDDEIGDLADALFEMTKALWQRMDAIENFAADVAHEIKNPLTSLRSAVETVARVKDSDQQRKLMSIIQDDVVRLDRLLTDISDASRLDAELSRAVMKPVNISPILSTLVDAYRISEDPDAPNVRMEEIDDLTVSGIESRLAQVFRNMIGNAISFSPKDGDIIVSAIKNETTVEISVTDQGPGIPEGKEADIFNRFYTERPESEMFGSHSGLGLSISRQIVETHEGEMFAENRRKEEGAVCGARFVVRLPLEV
jgi:two-component system sensor histidine kinase ChvG